MFAPVKVLTAVVVLVMARSAVDGVTAIAAVEPELFAGVGSDSAAATVAALVTVPPVALTFATRVTVALAPTASEPIEHVTVVVPEQVPCDGVALTKLRPAGSTSVITTVVATDGPALVAVIV